MVALAPILRLVRENSSVGNFCFLFKHFSEAPTPVLNREVEKSGSHARVRYTGPLGQRFPWSFLRGKPGNWTKLQCKTLLVWKRAGREGDMFNFLQRHSEPFPFKPLSLSLPPPTPFSTVVKDDIEFATVIRFKHLYEWYQIYIIAINHFHKFFIVSSWNTTPIKTTHNDNHHFVLPVCGFGGSKKL